MLQPTRPRAVHGPTLARFLADLARADLIQPQLSPSERLSQWLDWPHAVALSHALEAPLPAAAPVLTDSEDSPCASVRAKLTRIIGDDPAFAPSPSGLHKDGPFYQQRCLALQQKMDAGVAPLRERLRQTLSAAGPDCARLAAMDAVLERTLGRHERTLLARIPVIVGEHCEWRMAQLRQHGAVSAGQTTPPSSRDTDEGLATFHNNLHQLLLAELDLRLQPAEGLYATLCHFLQESHAQNTA